MKYTIIWKEHFKVSSREDRYVTIKREYDDEKATRQDVAAYIKLRTAQKHAHQASDKIWTDKTKGIKYKIMEHAFTDGNDTHTMWIGPSLLA